MTMGAEVWVEPVQRELVGDDRAIRLRAGFEGRIAAAWAALLEGRRGGVDDAVSVALSVEATLDEVDSPSAEAWRGFVERLARAWGRAGHRAARVAHARAQSGRARLGLDAKGPDVEASPDDVAAGPLARFQLLGGASEPTTRRRRRRNRR